jgi:ribonuclease E
MTKTARKNHENQGKTKKTRNQSRENHQERENHEKREKHENRKNPKNTKKHEKRANGHEKRANGPKKARKTRIFKNAYQKPQKNARENVRGCPGKTYSHENTRDKFTH